MRHKHSFANLFIIFIYLTLSIHAHKSKSSASKIPPNAAPDGQLAQRFFNFLYPIWLRFSLGISPDEIDHEPLSAFSLPTYANWTGSDWLMRLHGFAYRTPVLTVDRVDTLSNLLLSVSGVPIQSLSLDQINRVRNATSDIFVIPVDNEQILPVIHLPTGTTVPLDYHIYSNKNGYFTSYLTLPRSESILLPDFDTPHIPSPVQGLRFDISNAESNPHHPYSPDLLLVPPYGLTFLSDVDDILRIARVWRPSYAVMTMLTWDFIPWLNMPDVFADFANRWPNAHFHYTTVGSELFAPLYARFLQANYPRGSMDSRSISGIVNSRERSHREILRSFPHRRFVLMTDISNVELMNLYPQLAKEFSHISCLLLRNTTHTDPSQFVSPKLSAFRGLDASRYMFFTVPNDLLGIDFEAGECRNRSAINIISPAEFLKPAGPFISAMNWFRMKWTCLWKGEEAGEQCKLINSGIIP